MPAAADPARPLARRAVHDDQVAPLEIGEGVGERRERASGELVRPVEILERVSEMHGGIGREHRAERAAHGAVVEVALGEAERIEQGAERHRQGANRYGVGRTVAKSSHAAATACAGAGHGGREVGGV